MIRAKDKPWNSATTLYIARKLEAFAQGTEIAVLDMGCGYGTILEYLIDYNYDVYGYDFGHRKDSLEESNLKKHLGKKFDSHIKITDNEKRIPFPDDSFDVVYANQVFEHIKFIDAMFQNVQECSRQMVFYLLIFH